MANSQKDKPDNLSTMLESVGYTTNVARHKPSEIIESPGVQQELTALGFTVENANSVVGTILLDGKEAARDRLKAAELVYKVHGSFAEDRTPAQPSVVNIFNDSAVLMATRTFEDNLKQIIAHESTQPIPKEAETDSAQDAGSGA